MPQPTSREEYNERFAKNNRVDGFGLDVICRVPCPFCAAPDFARWKVLEVEHAMQQPETCSDCGRSAKAIVTRTDDGVSFEIVQTGGPDQPEWLEPKMRRVSHLPGLH